YGSLKSPAWSCASSRPALSLFHCPVESKTGRMHGHVKYWEIIIENLRNAGWNCGCMASTDGKGRPIWVVAAERGGAGRFIVHADQELPAFLELEAAVQNRGAENG